MRTVNLFMHLFTLSPLLSMTTCLARPTIWWYLVAPRKSHPILGCMKITQRASKLTFTTRVNVATNTRTTPLFHEHMFPWHFFLPFVAHFHICQRNEHNQSWVVIHFAYSSCKQNIYFTKPFHLHAFCLLPLTLGISFLSTLLNKPITLAISTCICSFLPIHKAWTHYAHTILLKTYHNLPPPHKTYTLSNLPNILTNTTTKFENQSHCINVTTPKRQPKLNGIPTRINSRKQHPHKAWDKDKSIDHNLTNMSR